MKNQFNDKPQTQPAPQFVCPVCKQPINGYHRCRAIKKPWGLK